MTRHTMKTATSILVIGALSAPLPGIAQSTDETAEATFLDALTACETMEPPCLTEDGLVRFADGTEVSPDDLPDDFDLEALLDGEAVDTPATDAQATDANTSAETEPAQPEIVTEGEPEAAPDAAVSTENAEADGTIIETLETLTEEDVSPDTTETTQAEPTDAAVPTETAADTVAGEDAPTAEAAETSPPAEVGNVTDSQPTEGAPADADNADAVALDDADAAEVMAETPSDAAPLTDEELAEEAASEAEAAAMVDDASEIAAAAEDATPSEESVTEEIVTEDVRSASEEFETALGEERQAEDNDGLSNFEKLLLLGAGTLAIGAILDNGDRVVANTGDRVVVARNGDLVVLKDDDTLLRQPGATVRTENFSDGSTRKTVLREDGSRVVTIRSSDGRVLRRAKYTPDGQEFVLFDDTRQIEPVDVTTLPEVGDQDIDFGTDEDALRAALARAEVQRIDRSFSLNQIRNIRAVRALAPEIELDNVTFASGSAAITSDQAAELAALGRTMRAMIADNPREMFLIEGHTDAVGSATFNLALSDRRAESLALALTEYFDVPPENMVIQGYGERYLKLRTPEAEVANRRAVVRLITPLL